jgi:hypothetical protein
MAVAAVMVLVAVSAAVEMEAGQSRRAARRWGRCGSGYGYGYNYRCCVPQSAPAPAPAPHYEYCAGKLCPMYVFGNFGSYCAYYGWHCSQNFAAQLNHECGLATGCNNNCTARCVASSYYMTSASHTDRKHGVADGLKHGYRFKILQNKKVRPIEDVDDLHAHKKLTITPVIPLNLFVTFPEHETGRTITAQLMQLRVSHDDSAHPTTTFVFGVEVDEDGLETNPADSATCPDPVNAPGLYKVTEGGTEYDVIVRQK